MRLSRIALLAVAAAGAARWGDARGGSITTALDEPLICITAHPDFPGTLYAGGLGAFKSTDGGASWFAANDGLNLPTAPEDAAVVTFLAQAPTNPDVLYAATRDSAFQHDAIFLTTNGAETWSPVTYPLEGTKILSLCVDGENPGTVLAGTVGDGIFKSTDGGQSWSPINAGLTFLGAVARRVTVILRVPAATGAFYAGTDGSGLYRTTDGATSWEPIEPSSIECLATDPTGAVLYAGSDPNMVKSVDAGASWNVIIPPPGDNVSAVAVDPSHPTTVYAANYQGLFRSFDGGASWSPLGDFRPLRVAALWIDSSGRTLHVATGGGEFIVTEPSALGPVRISPVEPPRPAAVSRSH
jgi:hypothetical protein